MRRSKLSDHTFQKGKFITPINAIPLMYELEDEKSWTYGRMPEYLWIGLILKYYGRDEGLRKSYGIISALHKLAPGLYTARLSQILKLDADIQKRFYDYIICSGAKEALAPLTVFLTASKAPVFAKCFYCPDQSVEDRCEAIIQTMREIMDHQSNEATDIRFVALYFNQLSGEVHLLREQVDLLVAYPSSKHTDEIMCMARPTVRSLEMMILTFEEVDSAYLKEFWRCVSEMTDCSIFAIRFSEEKRNITAYMEKLHEVFVYLSELFLTADPLNEKMSVLLGIATYSYKRLKEIYEHQLFNSISGRSCVRVLIEDYIMMKYLVKNESFYENIWRDYQLYGMGLYKLVLARHRENGALEESHFDEKYIEALVNESCIEYGCIPYIRYPVSLHYISLLSESMLDIEHIVKLRFKMSVAFVVYQLCDKGRLARVSLEEFLKQIQAYNFNEKLFRVLAEHDINENSFLGHTITQLVIDELEAFYNILAEESGI